MHMIKYVGSSRQSDPATPIFEPNSSGPVRRAAISFADPAKEVTRGLILECGYKRGVAVRAVRDLVLLLPILAAPSPRHRADVPVQLADMASGGFSGLRLFIRAGYSRLARIKSQTFLGSLTDATLARVNAALKREAEALAFEDTPPIASTVNFSDWTEGFQVVADEAFHQLRELGEASVSDLEEIVVASYRGRRKTRGRLR